MTHFSRDLISQVKRVGLTYAIDREKVILQATTASVGLFEIELEVVDTDGIVRGYITGYGGSKYGALPADRLGVAPRVFREVEPALRKILG